MEVFYGSPDRFMKSVHLSPVSNTLYSIANSLFMLEKIIKSREDIPEVIEIPYFMDLTEIEIEKICSLMKKAILDVLCEDVDFKFIRKKRKKIRIKFDFKNYNTICLFSGGIDSTLGILTSNKKYDSLAGLYVAHGDLGRITKKVSELNESLLKPNKIDLYKMVAPPMGKGYSQLRGFLYSLYAMILGFFCNSDKIIISECGSTMYQPRFAPMDTITYTTNPYVLAIAKEIGKIILKREIILVTPFEDFTKTEMMQLIKDDTILSRTHSCISSRWGINCGRCYACIARMIGSVNLSLDLSYFKYNLFQEENHMMDSFLNFCFDYSLFEEGIDYWSLENIKHFSKEDLFNRTCLDVFLAIKKLSDANRLDMHYKIILDEYLKFNKEKLSEREEQIRNLKSPNFDSCVKDLSSL